MQVNDSSTIIFAVGRLQSIIDLASTTSRSPFDPVTVVGDEKEGVRKPEQVTLTLPAGDKSYILVVAAASVEYPYYTGQPSEYDYVVDWNITAGSTCDTGQQACERPEW